MRHLLRISLLYIVLLCGNAKALEFSAKDFSPYEILFIQDSYLNAPNTASQSLCNNGVQEVCDRIHWHYAPLYHIWGKDAEKLKIQQEQWIKRKEKLHAQYTSLCDNTDIFGLDDLKNPAKHPLKLLLKSSRQLFLSIKSLVHYHSPYLFQAEQSRKEHCVALSHSIYEVESYNFRRKEYFRPPSIDNALLASCLKYDNLISCIQTHHPLGSLYGAFLAKYDKNLADSTFANSTLDISLLFQAIFSQSKLDNAYRQILRRKGRYKRLCDTLEKQTQISLIHKLYPLSEPITSPYNLPFLCIAYRDDGRIYDKVLPFAEFAEFAKSNKWSEKQSEEQAKQVCQKMRESTQIKGHFITLEALYDIEKLNANFTQQKQETMAIFSKLCKKQDELNPSFTYPCQNLESVHYATLRTYLSADGACQGGILLRHKAEYDKEQKELEARRQQECQKRQCCCVP